MKSTISILKSKTIVTFKVICGIYLFVGCTDLDDAFIRDGEQVMDIILSVNDTIDPYKDNLITGNIKLVREDNRNSWKNIDPQLEIRVSHGFVGSPPFNINQGGTSKYIAKTGGGKLNFEWYIPTPVTNNRVSITSVLKMSDDRELTESRVIYLSRLSPTFVNLIFDKDSISYGVIDTIKAKVMLTNIEGEIGELIPIEVKQSSTTGNNVRIVRDGGFAINGEYYFKITNPNSNQGSVSVWVNAEGLTSESLPVLFK